MYNKIASANQILCYIDKKKDKIIKKNTNEPEKIHSPRNSEKMNCKMNGKQHMEKQKQKKIMSGNQKILI